MDRDSSRDQDEGRWKREHHLRPCDRHSALFQRLRYLESKIAQYK
jgi:hypothetical protein